MGTLAQNRPHSGKTYSCKIGRILDDGDDEDRAAVAQEMAGDSSNRAIGRWLSVSENTVNKHRRGDCACFRG